MTEMKVKNVEAKPSFDSMLKVRGKDPIQLIAVTTTANATVLQPAILSASVMVLSNDSSQNQPRYKAKKTVRPWEAHNREHNVLAEKQTRSLLPRTGPVLNSIARFGSDLLVDEVRSCVAVAFGEIGRQVLGEGFDAWANCHLGASKGRRKPRRTAWRVGALKLCVLEGG
ncbi:hypothetical protein HG530_000238 [Fusarium avenaceum]|nr:hypothetical protein HG530_000238 [Fusarium avenaceum]